MQKTATKTGLKVFVSINDKVYNSGEIAPKEYKKNMTIVFDDYLSQWNYTLVPVEKKISLFYDLAFIHDKNYQTESILKRALETINAWFAHFF